MLKAICILAGIVWFVLILRWDVLSDWQKTKINHTKEAVTRWLLLLPSFGFLFCGVSTGGGVWNWVLGGIVTFWMMGFGWWLFFDGWLNGKKGYNYWFTGSVDGDDPKSDTFLKRLPLWGIVTLKIGGFVIGVAAYIYLLTKN
jgi:hypothetical protein